MYPCITTKGVGGWQDWAAEDTQVKLVEVTRWLIDEHLAHLRGTKSQPGE
jgi:hypothetical protein